MDLRVLALVLFVTIYSVQGAFPKCCAQTSMAVSPHILYHVERYHFQNSGGVCEIDALV
uniref:Chemokine interleukin-8-like domain-containing protein n=1 Tax=Esox lucius TaxID=8010 RepID=A0AAY5KK69_ESOLU